MTPANPNKLLSTIQKYKTEIKSSDAIRDLFRDHDLPVDYIDFIPVAFAELDVSARTENGVIYLNFKLLKEPETIPHYLVHETTHWIQQCMGDGPTQGSAEGDYLENPFEIEGFNYQTEFIEEEDGEKAAERYIDRVLDHHDVKDKGEREEKKKELLAGFGGIIGDLVD